LYTKTREDSDFCPRLQNASLQNASLLNDGAAFPGWALATHVFFLWSARGRIAPGDPDFTVFYTAGLFPRYLS
jgi:hypothetical protein